MQLWLRDIRAEEEVEEERYCQIEDLFAILPAENYNVIINDILISVPAKAQKVIDEYCRRYTESANQQKIKSKRVRAFVKKVVGGPLISDECVIFPRN